METNDFADIRTFAELQQARRTLKRTMEEKRSRLWVPFVISFIRSLKDRLTDDDE